MVDQKLERCRELFRLLTEGPPDLDTKLTFASPQPGYDASFFVDNRPIENIREVVCFKPSFFSIFMEAHNYFQNKLLPRAANSDLYKSFYCTVGLLLTTPENKTNLKRHEALLLTLLNDKHCKLTDLLNKEIKLVKAMLSCSNNRLNKSSSLWFFLKKLYVLSKKFGTDDNRTIMSVFIMSASQHTSNYYCWNTSKMFFDIFVEKEQLKMLQQTEDFCFKNAKDCSAWSALGYMLTQNINRLSDNRTQFLRLCDNFGFSFDFSRKDWIEIDHSKFADKLRTYIDKMVVIEWPPFLCLITVVKSVLGKDCIFHDEWIQSVRDFEEKNGVIMLFNNNPEIPVNFEDDIVMSRTFYNIALKKKYLSLLNLNVFY